MRRHRNLFVAAVLTLAFAWMAGSDDVQAASTTYGTLRGTVVDEGGDPLAGVTVVISSVSQVRDRAMVTDGNGNYFAAGLNPGEYTVVARLSGFQHLRKSMRVLLDKVTVMDFMLPRGEMSETVTVTSERPVVDKTHTEGAYNLNKDFTEGIPLPRSYQSVLSLAPGVSNTGENSGNPNMMGGANESNQYLLDGVSIVDPVTGTFGSNLNFDMIEEFDIKLFGVSAEYGQFQGGVSNVITKSGGNDFTGIFRDTITSPSFDSEYNAGSQDEFTPGLPPPAIPPKGDRALANDIEVTFGGPIVRNNAWFFLSYNRNDSVRNVQLANPTGGPNGDGQYVRTFEGDNSLGKLTWQVTNDHKLSYNYFEDPALVPRCYGQLFWGGPCYDTGFVDNQAQGGFAWTGDWNAVWGSRVISDFKVSRWQNQFLITPLSPTPFRPDLIFDGNLGSGLAAGNGPTIDLNSGVLFDAPVFDDTPETREREQYEARVTTFLNSSFGTHTLKVGADYQEESRVGSSILSGNALIYTQGWVTNPPGLGGAGDPFDPDNRIYSGWYDFAPPGSGGPTTKTTAIYVQDDWSLNDHWSFNLGLRWEKWQDENDVGTKIIDQTGWAPRLGATFDVRGNGKHLLKATAARYNAGVRLTSLSAFNRAVGGQSEFDFYSNANPGTPGRPTWQLDFSVRPNPDTSQFSDDLRPQSIDEFTLGYEVALTPQWGLFTRYIYRKWDEIVGQQFSFDYPMGVGGPSVQIVSYDNRNDLEREYQSVILGVEKRFSDNWALQANYSYQDNDGNTTSDLGDTAFGAYPGVPQVNCPQTPSVPATAAVNQTGCNYNGTLQFNVEHQVKLFGTYRIPLPSTRHGLELGGRFDWRKGNGYQGTETTNVVVGPGGDAAQDNPLGTRTSDGVYIPGVDQVAQITEYFQPRGSLTEPDIWTLDLLFRYLFNFNQKVSFEARFEVRNVANNQKPLTVNNAYSDRTAVPTFGYPVGYSQFQRPRNYYFTLAIIW